MGDCHLRQQVERLVELVERSPVCDRLAIYLRLLDAQSGVRGASSGFRGLSKNPAR